MIHTACQPVYLSVTARINSRLHLSFLKLRYAQYRCTTEEEALLRLS